MRGDRRMYGWRPTVVIDRLQNVERLIDAPKVVWSPCVLGATSVWRRTPRQPGVDDIFGTHRVKISLGHKSALLVVPC